MWHHTITPRTRLFVCPKVLIMATSHNLPSLQHRCFHTFNAPSSHPPSTGCMRHLSGSSLEAVCQLQYETFLPKTDWCLLDVSCNLEGLGQYMRIHTRGLAKGSTFSKCVLFPPKQKGCHHKHLSIQHLLDLGSKAVLGMVWEPCKESI